MSFSVFYCILSHIRLFLLHLLMHSHTKSSFSIVKSMQLQPLQALKLCDLYHFHFTGLFALKFNNSTTPLLMEHLSRHQDTLQVRSSYCIISIFCCINVYSGFLSSLGFFTWLTLDLVYGVIHAARQTLLQNIISQLLETCRNDRFWSCVTIAIKCTHTHSICLGFTDFRQCRYLDIDKYEELVSCL